MSQDKISRFQYGSRCEACSVASLAITEAFLNILLGEHQASAQKIAQLETFFVGSTRSGVYQVVYAIKHSDERGTYHGET